MSPKLRVQITPQQKLEYAKMMVEDGYTNQQIQDISGACSSAVVRWKRQYKEEMLGMTPTNRVALTPEQQRIQELEKQLARAKRGSVANKAWMVNLMRLSSYGYPS